MRETQNKATISVRLSADEERVVRILAKRRKRTVSDVVRDAVADYVVADQNGRIAYRPYDLMVDLIGSATDLPADLSENTGEKVAAIVREKAARRR
ncbi:MAG: hypothetical protein QOE82_3231 [Thermoanaerobaculia bacterium]|jgi:predicted DNA-binding protein|nr:hypothetical protein [Thermoanaerobaculia bacterium]